MLLVIAIAAFCTTFIGGLLALRIAPRLPWILGFSAGAVIAVAFFDLLPEALELGSPRYSSTTLLAATLSGFLIYLCLDRAVFRSAHGGPPATSHGKTLQLPTAQRGALFAGSLSLHSVLDGLGIGLAFQASPSVGLIVTIAVLTHDFADGLNTMNVVMRNGGTRQAAFRWLLADAVAPGAGIYATHFFSVPVTLLGLVLATFAGFFLYIGASDLLPESHRHHPTLATTAMTALGACVLYVVVSLARL